MSACLNTAFASEPPPTGTFEGRPGQGKSNHVRHLPFKGALHPVNPDMSGRGTVNGGAEKKNSIVQKYRPTNETPLFY
jgi:hypothetical protein